MPLLTQREVEDLIEEVELFGIEDEREYDSLCWLRDLYYARAEGFIDCVGELLFPGDGCLNIP